MGAGKVMAARDESQPLQAHLILKLWFRLFAAKEAVINSSSPRRRGSSTLFLMDSRLRGNDKIDLISSSLTAVFGLIVRRIGH